jgi:hypothetical protein
VSLKSSSLCLYSSNSGTFWLKIEQFWPFEEISIFSNGGHLGYRTALTDTILKGDHPRIISAKFDRLCKLEKRGDEIKIKSYPLKLLSQSQPNFAEMMLGWSPFKIVSVSAVLYPRWPPLLKIEISNNKYKQKQTVHNNLIMHSSLNLINRFQIT